MKEQKELSQRQMKQRIVIEAVSMTDGKIMVDADRLIIAGEIRSSFRFPLSISISRVIRSEANPYGLRLDASTSLTKEVKKP